MSPHFSKLKVPLILPVHSLLWWIKFKEQRNWPARPTPMLATSSCSLHEWLFLVGVNQLREPGVFSALAWPLQRAEHRGCRIQFPTPASGLVRDLSRRTSMEGTSGRQAGATFRPSSWSSRLLPEPTGALGRTGLCYIAPVPPSSYLTFKCLALSGPTQARGC